MLAPARIRRVLRSWLCGWQDLLHCLGFDQHTVVHQQVTPQDLLFRESLVFDYDGLLAGGGNASKASSMRRHQS